jgi:propionyl-CoA carboxylase alpha chain
MFKKILIANRGEIACRIMKTAHRLGIRTVAVYSEADRSALHVKMAGEAVAIGPPPPTESYLSIERILQVCRDTRAEAVHPGYGFLSENAAFAAALEKAGLVFIGPGRHAIACLGDKLASKELARKAGVTVVPGASGPAADVTKALRAADGIGYPVMLKAAAGGGGKGMRVARNRTEVREGFERARSEARSSFADDRVFLEKYIEEPRHIEMQILADRHGHVVHLGERECSIQRRHQKVIEEAPSPFLDEKMRAAMGAQAVALAKAAGYVSAGTVEFMVDKDRHFYFLEVNTRLQVEHPVTEMVTGLDLVELMIRIAAGEKLPFAQRDVSIRGWSLEVRVYAEDPTRDFLPSVGRLVRYVPPAENPSVRVDTGVAEGDEITIHYDPLVAKLITHGSTRDDALDAMRSALDGYYIRGLSHNLGFLSALVSHPRFVQGRLSTDFIAQEYPDGFHPAHVPHYDPALLIVIAAFVHRRHLDRDAAISGQMRGLEYRVSDDWVVVVNGAEHHVTVRPDGDGHVVTQDRKTYRIRSDWQFGQPFFRGEINGTRVCVDIERRNIAYCLRHRGAQMEALVLTPFAAKLNRFMPKRKPPDPSRFLRSPMPGLLASINVKAGDEVKEGEALAVVEAMKMEITLRAAQNRRVKAVLAEPGAGLAVDQPILEFEEDA